MEKEIDFLHPRRTRLKSCRLNLKTGLCGCIQGHSGILDTSNSVAFLCSTNGALSCGFLLIYSDIKLAVKQELCLNIIHKIMGSFCRDSATTTIDFVVLTEADVAQSCDRLRVCASHGLSLLSELQVKTH